MEEFHQVLETGQGIVEGVKFDLLHPAILSGKWFSPELSHWHMPGRAYSDSSFVFPWQKKADRYTDPFDGKIPVKSGDRVRIARVATVTMPDPFEHEADSAVCEVYLEIVRNGATLVSVIQPVTFYRRGSILPPRVQWGGMAFPKIADRICEANGGLENIFDLCLCHGQLAEAVTGEDAEEGETWEENALRLAQRLSIERAAIIAAVEGREFEFSDFAQTTKGSMLEYRKQFKPTAHDVGEAFDLAVALGYWWARYEAEHTMRPFAELGLASKRGGFIGGKKSGEARRRKAARTWQAHALELAHAARKQKPHLSQESVVADIEAGWKLRDVEPPSGRTLRAYISEMERAKKLPRRLAANPLRRAE